MAEYIERGKILDAIAKDHAKRDEREEKAALNIWDNIKKISSADVVEVRHGRWEEERWCDNFQHCCSLCHKTVRVHPQSVAYVYCPYCGAKMEGKGASHE